MMLCFIVFSLGYSHAEMPRECVQRGKQVIKAKRLQRIKGKVTRKKQKITRKLQKNRYQKGGFSFIGGFILIGMLLGGIIALLIRFTLLSLLIGVFFGLLGIFLLLIIFFILLAFTLGE